MTPTTFVASAPVTATVSDRKLSVCSFVARPAVLTSARPRHASITMSAQSDREDGYVIRESEFRDPDTDDDSGDGFIGEAEMDDMLGVSMPDDLASFEKREIQNSRNRDELVSKLRDIAVRRRDILEDRRKGMGMDNVDNYLNNL